MSNNTFDTTWLNTRFPFDEAARSSQVNKACLNTLSQNRIPPNPKPKIQNSPTAQLNLLDVGSGTGANFLHFFESIPASQNWFFLDHDSRLLTASLQRIATYVAERGYPMTKQKDGLELQVEGQVITVKTISGSFEELENLLPLADLDLVMASAFFDLFMPSQLQSFLDKVFAANCDLLLTLNYASMTFAPAHPLDEAMVAWYEQHMQRPKAGGIPMGPNCSRLIRKYLEEKQLYFWEEPSVWKIGGADQAMLRFLLGFMEEALGELDLLEEEKEQIAAWLRMRREQVDALKLHLEVSHFDFFASDR